MSAVLALAALIVMAYLLYAAVALPPREEADHEAE